MYYKKAVYLRSRGVGKSRSLICFVLGLGVLFWAGGLGDWLGANPDLSAADQVDYEQLKSAVGYQGVVAQVNKDIILATDVYGRSDIAFRSLLKSFLGDSLKQKSRELFKKTLQNLVDQKLVEQFSQKEDLQVSPQEWHDEQIRQIKMYGSKALLIEKLSQLGESYETWKKGLRFQILERKLVRRLLGMEGSSKSGLNLSYDVFVSPLEIRKYYDTHPKEFAREARIKFLSIKIPYQGETKSKVQAFMASIHRQLREGASFKALAQWYNFSGESPSPGWLPRGVLVGTPLAALFSLKVGQISPVVDTGETLELYKVVGRRKAIQRHFDDPNVQEEIQGKLFNYKVSEVLGKVHDLLIKSSYIKVFIR